MNKFIKYIETICFVDTDANVFNQKLLKISSFLMNRKPFATVFIIVK